MQRTGAGMQFVSGGPDIPEHLLQAHEDGKVVFFAEQESHILPACLALEGS